LGYDNDAPVVVRLGENLSGREVERVANFSSPKDGRTERIF
jgi:hypothetical protein